MVSKKDLEVWSKEYGGTTADGIARRVINGYRLQVKSGTEELSKEAGLGQKRAKVGADGQEAMAVETGRSALPSQHADPPSEIGEKDITCFQTQHRF